MSCIILNKSIINYKFKSVPQKTWQFYDYVKTHFWYSNIWFCSLLYYLQLNILRIQSILGLAKSWVSAWLYKNHTQNTDFFWKTSFTLNSFIIFTRIIVYLNLFSSVSPDWGPDSCDRPQFLYRIFSCNGNIKISIV